jgi:transposase
MLWTAPTLQHQGAIGWLRRNEPLEGSRPWARLARSVSISRSRFFQIHGVDFDGAVVMRKRIIRAKLLEFFAALPACLVGIEACPTAHHWSRRLQALGHTVRLLPPSYVKAYVKRSKNDANDAAAICEAVTRPSMRFVATKSEQQQSGLMLHRSRQLLVCQRTMLSNAIRGHLAGARHYLGEGPQWHGRAARDHR